MAAKVRVPEFKTLKECLEFLEWLKNDRGMQGQVANRLERLLKDRYKEAKQGGIENALSRFVGHASEFYKKLCTKASATYNSHVSATTVLKSLIVCIPKLLSAIYFLRYKVDANFKALGGGEWAEQEVGVVAMYARIPALLESNATKIDKYLITKHGSTQYGVIPGGFEAIELRAGFRGGYNPGSAMANDLTKICEKEKAQFFRDVFVTSVFGNDGANSANVANAVRLVEDFGRIFGNVTKDDDFKSHLQSNRMCIDWQALEAHCAKLKTSLEKIFKTNGFSFTGYGRTVGEVKKENVAKKMATWLKKHLIEIRTNLAHIKPFDNRKYKLDDRRLRKGNKLPAEFSQAFVDYFTENFFRYGFTFGKNKYEMSDTPYQDLLESWNAALVELKRMTGDLDQLKTILDGNQCPDRNRNKQPKSKPEPNPELEPALLDVDDDENDLESESDFDDLNSESEDDDMPPTKTEASKLSSTTNVDTTPQNNKSEGAQNQGKKAEGNQNQGNDHSVANTSISPVSQAVRTQSSSVQSPDSGSPGATGPSSGPGPGGQADVSDAGQPGVQKAQANGDANGTASNTPGAGPGGSGTGGNGKSDNGQQTNEYQEGINRLKIRHEEKMKEAQKNMERLEDAMQKLAEKKAERQKKLDAQGMNAGYRSYYDPKASDRRAQYFTDLQMTPVIMDGADVSNEALRNPGIEWERNHRDEWKLAEQFRKEAEKREKQKFRRNLRDTQEKVLNRLKDSWLHQEFHDDDIGHVVPHRSAVDDRTIMNPPPPNISFKISKPFNAKTIYDEQSLTLPHPNIELEIDKTYDRRKKMNTYNQKVFYTEGEIIEPKPPTISPPIIETGPFGSKVADPNVDTSKMLPDDLIPKLPPDTLDVEIIHRYIPPPNDIIIPDIPDYVLADSAGSQVLNDHTAPTAPTDKEYDGKGIHSKNEIKTVNIGVNPAFEVIDDGLVIGKIDPPSQPVEAVDLQIDVPKPTLQDSSYDIDLEYDHPPLPQIEPVDPIGSVTPAIKINLAPPEALPDLPNNTAAAYVYSPSTVGMCISSWTTSKPTDHLDIPETELSPSQAPRTVRDMLTWLAGLRNPKHHKTLKLCINRAFNGLHNESSDLALSINHTNIRPNDVFDILQLTAMFAGSVLTAISPTWKANVPSRTVKPQSSNESQKPDCCALLCQLRDYAYACCHQLEFLKAQCNRDKLSGGWGNYEYGSDIKTPSPLQAFLTDGWDSTFKTHPFDPCNLCHKSRVRMGFKREDLPETSQLGSVISTILTPSCGGEERDALVNTKL
ncbi:hypothetical protein BBBOND_0310250 [Babesia bigemina]|uniref:Ribosome-binding protein 1 n=1 Tax=Babesia bigemina TaxID=5866 RepID=A0A061DAV2_BABBI|nr:hypothetical protein BBBOND_0310250 [Babesia bigemina]CDR97122.1 hypothetical protein BBBOND_0310250 [Babesia bigemina]|eukprot:XP_012769308.1 hypothetical protein BBBOND_0310250 [Babesia bigemina]